MNRPAANSVGRHLLGEFLFGNRGLIKANMMLLPWAVMIARGRGVSRPDTVPMFYSIWLTVVGWLTTCILANDLADRRVDRAFGKQRWINRLAPGLRAVVTGFFFASGRRSSSPLKLRLERPGFMPARLSWG